MSLSCPLPCPSTPTLTLTLALLACLLGAAALLLRYFDKRREAAPIRIDVMRLSKTASIPTYATDGDACVDMHADLIERGTFGGRVIGTAEGGRLRIGPGEWVVIPTGLALAVPRGYSYDLRPRSGMAAKRGVTLLNAPGTIDAPYRGEIGVIVINHSTEPFEIAHGDRICQAMVSRSRQIAWNVVSELDETQRGAGGFGHSGGFTPPS